MAENLPDWAVEGADVMFVRNPSGMGRGEVKHAVIEKITPTGQLRTSASTMRFMPGDYSNRENRFQRYLHSGSWYNGSIELLPPDHPRVPRLIAEQEHDAAWSGVRSAMHEMEKHPSSHSSQRLRAALEAWDRTQQAVAALTDMA